MNKYVSFISSAIFFIFTWYILLHFEYLKSVSPNNAILFCTIALILSTIFFLTLSIIYYFENIEVPDEEFKNRIKCSSFLDPLCI